MTLAEKFVKALEQTYGPYAGPTMRTVIANHYKKTSQKRLFRIFAQITECYMPNYQQPPTLAHILKYERDLPPAPMLPLSMIEDKTEEYVTPEEGLEFIKNLMEGLGKKNGKAHTN